MASKVPRRIGKAQAREEFSTLIEKVSQGSGPIEITDYGKVTAIILSEKEYEWLKACAKKTSHPRREARGLVVIEDANAIKEADALVKADFVESLKKSERQL